MSPDDEEGWEHEDQRDLDPDEIDALLAAYSPTAEPAATDDLDQDPELDQFLSEPEPDYDWLIPQILERGDRLILTGAEGAGKSTLLRQMAVQSAAGIHPFNHSPMPAVNVLLVDLENGRRHTKRELRPLRLAAGVEYPDARLNVIIRSGGLNLCDPLDQVWLDERVRANAADLVVIGPIYKMHLGDATEEGPARLVAAVIDGIREREGTTFVIEAHSPHSVNGGKRPTRPYGASLWMRWPEFGLHITETGQLEHWRGDRDEREWPAALTRGGDWPWTPPTRTTEATYAELVRVVSEHGAPMSYGEIASVMKVSKAWVGKVIKANRRKWDDLRDKIGGDWPS